MHPILARPPVLTGTRLPAQDQTAMTLALLNDIHYCTRHGAFTHV